MRRRSIALTLVLLIPGACRIEETPRPATPADVAREEIQKAFAEYQQALLAGDARRAVAVFTTDARVYEAGEPDRVGRTDILAAMTASLARGPLTYISNDSEAIDIAPGGVAYELGSFEERIRRGDEVEHTLRGHYAVKWVRGAEALWRINRLMRYAEPVDSTVARDSAGT